MATKQPAKPVKKADGTPAQTKRAGTSGRLHRQGDRRVKQKGGR